MSIERGGECVAHIRRTCLTPTDDQSVLLREGEQVISIVPTYEPDGVWLDVFIIQTEHFGGDAS